MAKIFFDTDELEGLESILDDISSSLSSMMEKVCEFDVPSVWYDWFSQKQFLDDSYRDSGSPNLYRGISDAKNSCSEIEKWIGNCKKNFKSFSDNLVTSIDSIEDVDLKPRESIVVSK